MKTRTFAQIIQDEQNQRNIIEIQLNRIVTNNSDPKSLTYEELENFCSMSCRLILMTASPLISILEDMIKEK